MGGRRRARSGSVPGLEAKRASRAVARGGAAQPAPVPAERATPPPAPQLAAPAIQLAKRVEIRPARSLAPGALEGTVLDAETNAVISLEGRRAVAPNLPVAPLSPEAETGADGRFTLEQVPPDAMSLYAQKEGYLTRMDAIKTVCSAPRRSVTG